MSEILEEFSKAHDALRELQSYRALHGFGCAKPVGGFTIMWDGVADLAPPFEVRVGDKVRSCATLKRAILAATEMMEDLTALAQVRDISLEAKK